MRRITGVRDAEGATHVSVAIRFYRALAMTSVLATLVASCLLCACSTIAFASEQPPPEVNFSASAPGGEGVTEDIRRITETTAFFEGEVNPGGGEAEWKFEYATSSTGPWTPVPKGEGKLPADTSFHVVTAEVVGLSPITTYYARLVATNAGGATTRPGFEPNGRFVTAGPPHVATFAVHAIQVEPNVLEGETRNGEMRVLGELDPEGVNTGYYFESVTQEDFEASGFTQAAKSPEVEVKAMPEVSTPGTHGDDGATPRTVGELLPGLQSGTTYRYRMVGHSANGTSIGSEHTLTVPMPSGERGPGSCQNQALRYGPSARLPDCRAYEQVTPQDKSGAMDIYRYGLVFESSVVGEGGEHFELHAPGVQWGTSPDSDASSYFFNRSPSGWQMMSDTPQPEAGVARYLPTVFSSNLTEVGLNVEINTSPVEVSPDIEYKVGSPGGPYVTAASVPRSEVPSGGGWVAEAPDGRVLVLEVEDHTLIGDPTGTTNGTDLYEYREGHLAQINVLGGSPGTPISTCGAKLAGESHAHPVSVDGSRILFTDNCTNELYMRIDGTETVVIGQYKLLYANPDVTQLLLEKKTGETQEFFMYGVESKEAHVVLVSHQATDVAMAEDFETLYIGSRERLASEAPLELGGSEEYIYRDVQPMSVDSISYIGTATSDGRGDVGLSPSDEGRYLYIDTDGIAGFDDKVGKPIAGFYRYDSTEDSLECITCASSFAPESQSEVDGEPSENGDYVFFDTVAALVPEDVDGEVGPEAIKPEPGVFSPHPSNEYSVSSDVYEWRRNGLDGCDQIQGCLSLLTSGLGGFKNVLLGSTASGGDVFIATHEALVAQDTDTSGDVYDVRIDGGFPPPLPRPVECEGDACDTPVAAPIDKTPASLSFSGPGNSPIEVGKNAGEKPKQKKPKPKDKPKTKSKAKGKSKSKGKPRGTKAGTRAGTHTGKGRDGK